MSIFNQKLGPSGLSVQSGGNSTNLNISRLVCAGLLAGLMFAGGSAKAYNANVLVNPGAETGDLTGWTPSLTGYIYVVSTNGTIPNSGGSNFLAHSGKFTFQLFNTTANTTYLYQDYAAVSNSQWSASAYAICYASNYFQPGANAHMQMVFYDISNNVVVSPYSMSGSAGTYGSDFLDPSGPPDPSLYYIFAPPMAVDASGWVYLTPTNIYDGDPATEVNWEAPLSPIPTVVTAPPGTAKVRYQIEFDNSATSGGDVYWDDCALNKLNLTDPDITNPPVAVTVFAGNPASFSVIAARAVKTEVLKYQWQLNGTDLPPAGNINGIFGPTTNSTLYLENCQSIDAGLYDVVVSDTNGFIRSVPVPLNVLVLSPLGKANRLGANAGFELNPSWPLWNIFNGCNFATSTNVYGTSTTTVNVLDGNSVALVGANGDRDNGFWQAVPNVTPGTLWKAGGWAYISSLNDFVAGNTCRLQIWFKDSGGNAFTNTPTFESFKLYGLSYTNADTQYTNIDTSSANFGQVGYHAQLPRDQWVYLPVTNWVNNSGIGLGDDLPTNTFSSGYFIVPTNANVAEINFQVYEYCPVAGDTNSLGQPPEYLGSAVDAVYWDDMELIQVLPVTNLTATVSGGNINLSFAAGAGLTYSVLYKTNLADATWTLLSNNIAAPMTWQTNTTVTTTIWPITVSDPIGSQHRFYRVQSQ
jgi:hypothetical protein